MAINTKFQDNHKLLFFIVLFLIPISQFSLDIYTPSLPKIVTNLNTTSSKVQQTITVFLFAVGIGQFIFGILADSYGRKSMLFLGMLLFTLSSIVSMWAPSINILLISRIFQGLGISSIAVLSKAICVDLYSKKDLLKASAWIGFFWGVSPIIAPVIGGYIEEYSHWRISFLTLTIYGFIGTLLTLFIFKETLIKKQKFKPKLIFKNSFKIIKNKDFLCCTIIVASTNLGIFVFNIMGPFFIQTVMKKSAIFYGYMGLVIGTVYIIGAFLSRIGVKYYQSRQTVYSVTILLFLISIMSLVFSYIFPKSILIMMISSGAVAFVSAYLYPFLIEIMFEPFENISGMVSSNYGIISYTFTSIFTFIFSQFKIKSGIEIAWAYGIVAIICLASMSIMFDKSFFIKKKRT